MSKKLLGFIRLLRPEISILGIICVYIGAIASGSPYFSYAKANYERNTLIARDSDVLIAVVAPDRKGGTEDTIKKWNRFHKETPELLRIL